MSLRKVVALLSGFAIAVGLIGSGVGAQFTAQVSAQEKLNVGTFGCQITDHSAGTLSPDGSSLYYDAGTITSSAASSMPLNFKVVSTGTIPVVLNILATPLPSPFVDLLTLTAPVTLTTGGSHTYLAGISWPELNNSNLGQSASIAYVVNCTEVGAAPVTNVTYTGVANGTGNEPTDIFAGTGFLPNANLSIFMLRMGSPVVFDVNTLGAHNADGVGTWNYSYPDNCQPSDGSPAVHVDMPVVVWASDGTRSAIGTGVVPCSHF